MAFQEQVCNVGKAESASGNMVRSILVEKPNDAENKVDALLGRAESPTISVNVVNQVLDCEDRGNQQDPLVYRSPALLLTVSTQRGRASSCPPRPTRSIASGPWSLEWLTD